MMLLLDHGCDECGGGSESVVRRRTPWSWPLPSHQQRYKTSAPTSWLCNKQEITSCHSSFQIIISFIDFSLSFWMWILSLRFMLLFRSCWTNCWLHSNETITHCEVVLTLNMNFLKILHVEHCISFILVDQTIFHF